MEDLVDPLDLVLGLLAVGSQDLAVLHELALQLLDLLLRRRILKERDERFLSLNALNFRVHEQEARPSHF